MQQHGVVVDAHHLATLYLHPVWQQAQQPARRIGRVQRAVTRHPQGTGQATAQGRLSLGQLWGWGTYALSHGGLSKVDDHRYAVWSAGVDGGTRQSQSFLERAVAANPELKSKLKLAAFDEVAKFREFSKEPEQLLLQKDLTPKLYYGKGEAALLGLMSFYDDGLPVLDGLLAQRIRGMQHRMGGIALAAAISRS